MFGEVGQPGEGGQSRAALDPRRRAIVDLALALALDSASLSQDDLEAARDEILAFTAFPKEIWTQIWSNNPTERLNKRRSAGAPTPSGSSPTARPSSASSAPSWPSRPTNGPKVAATSD